MKIDVLKLKDADAYRELMLEGYRDFPQAFTSSYEARAQSPLAWWQDRLSAAGMRIFGAGDEDGQLAGCVGLLQCIRELPGGR